MSTALLLLVLLVFSPSGPDCSRGGLGLFAEGRGGGHHRTQYGGYAHHHGNLPTRHATFDGRGYMRPFHEEEQDRLNQHHPCHDLDHLEHGHHFEAVLRAERPARLLSSLFDLLLHLFQPRKATDGKKSL
eukprot:gene1954-2132_t